MNRTWGNRAFSAAATSLWNTVPKHIRDCTELNTVKTLTKTYLFKIAFNVELVSFFTFLLCCFYIFLFQPVKWLCIPEKCYIK